MSILDEMERRGVRPDLVTYNTAMDALGKAGEYEKALRLFGEVERKGKMGNWGLSHICPRESSPDLFPLCNFFPRFRFHSQPRQL